ncbi:MAG TPA: DUF5916 domain-containing protein [Tahibacter sp.]|uniref:DUF5916 domain-containing protein n=1 Tax=Tahibacter sp. TaxID=2056211 RepID=UPI002B96E20F|nr:DUF5916 domain-containing protein [Tahibacter sp.]HSX59329.1 DUF5916 domain-containing protein [Tahibacter sp.]
MRTELLAFFLLAATGTTAHAATLRIDGRADEEQWRDAHVFRDFKRTQPYTLDAATVVTEARMLSTPEGIAFAFRCEQPAGLQRVKPFTPRDRIRNADRVNVNIDFDADGKIGYNFTVSLSDSIEDAIITEENQFNTDWDADWQHAVQEDAAGWNVELLLPWTIASMRGSDTPTRVVSVQVDRVLAERSERSATPPAFYGNPVYLSAFERITIPQYRAQILDLFPYVSALYDLKHPGSEFRAGADLFWKPSGDFQLTATVNPDFGQVESDELVVNFDAIETYYSDKRPFFTENQALFDMRSAPDGVLLYTRRVGAASDDGSGRAADITAALKLNGNAGNLKYGAFLAEEEDDAGRRFAAGRLLYTFGDSNIGALVTSVDRPALDRRAEVLANDWRWQLTPSVRLDGQFLLSQIDQSGTTTSDTGGVLRLSAMPNEQLQHTATFTHLGDELDFNDAGYMPRNSLNRLLWESSYKRSDLPADSAVAALTWEAEAMLRTNDRGDRLTSYLELQRTAELRAGGSYLFELRAQAAGYDDQISRGHGKVWIESRPWMFAEYASARRGKWQYTLGAWWMQEGMGGWAFQPEITLAYAVSDRLTLDGEIWPRWSRDWLIWLDGDRLARYRRSQWNTSLNVNWFPKAKHELRAKLQWFAIDAHEGSAYRIGARGRLVADGQAGDFSVNNFGLQLRYRYELAAQSELYLVYSRGGAEERDQRDDSGELFVDALSLRDADQFLAKLRYRF